MHSYFGDTTPEWFMRSLVNVAIHPSQFPENLRRDLLTSLRARQLNHKFLYDGLKQTRKWLALHDACSPARNDIDCVEAYDKAFGAAADRVAARRVHVISLGCGGGQKDTRLMLLLLRAMFPYMLVICLTAILMGMLNARGHFFVPAAARWC